MGSGARLVGVDAARGLAILGMLWAHVAPDGTRDGLADGRSAVLFAVLAGVSLGLITGGPRPMEDRRRGRLSVALRGCCLVALGLGLWTLGTPVAVILDTYGVLFVLLLPLLFAPRAVLAVATATSAVAGPLVAAAVGEDLRTPFSPERLLHLPSEWLVTGYYPGVVFAAYLLAGLLAARSDLGARRTQLALVAGGAIASVAGYAGAGMLGGEASAHSDTVFEVLGSGGLALALIGALQLAAASSLVRAVLQPLAAPGAMPLSIYTGQILLLAVWLLLPAAGSPPSIESWPLLAALVAASVAFALVWRRTAGRGPMEGLLAGLTATAPRTAGAVR